MWHSWAKMWGTLKKGNQNAWWNIAWHWTKVLKFELHLSLTKKKKKNSWGWSKLVRLEEKK